MLSSNAQGQLTCTLLVAINTDNLYWSLVDWRPSYLHSSEFYKPRWFVPFHKSQPNIHTMSHTNLVYAPWSCLFKLHLNNILPSAPRSSNYFPSFQSPYQIPTHILFRRILIPSPSHPKLFNGIKFGEVCNFWISLLSSFVRPLISLLHLGLNIFLGILFPNTLVISFSSMLKVKLDFCLTVHHQCR